MAVLAVSSTAEVVEVVGKICVVCGGNFSCSRNGINKAACCSHYCYGHLLLTTDFPLLCIRVGIATLRVVHDTHT